MNLLADNNGKWLYSLQFRDGRKSCREAVGDALFFEGTLTHKLGKFFPIAPATLIKWSE